MDSVKIIDVHVPIPDYVMQTLALGPKNPTLDKFDSNRILAEMDSVLEFCKSRVPDPEMKNEMESATISYNKNAKEKLPSRNVVLTNKFLKKNKLLAVPMDKSNGFAVMSEESYAKKMENILNAKQFEKIRKGRKNAIDPILSEEKKINEVLLACKKEGKLDEKLYQKLRSTGGSAPRLYGTAKTHKENTPLRPVLSMCGSVYYNIAANIARWLSVIPEAKINSSTEQMVNDIKGLTLEAHEVLISYDVVSLYTNVPVDEAITKAVDLLYSGKFIDNEPPIDKSTFLKLANLCLKNVCLLTTDGYYKQSEGLAMGSPAAPMLANIWMAEFDDV